MNVAVVGLGFMGVTHLRGYLQAPGARIAAVCDPVRLPINGRLAGVTGNIKTSDAIDLGPDVKVCSKLDELLADPDIDLIDICTPTPLHPAQAIAALQAGKHVVCEKPLARTSLAAAEILQVAQHARGFLMPAMCMRFWPGWSWLKEAVTHQQFGKVLAARFRRVSEMPAWSKQGTYQGGNDLGGALFDLHIHDTDFVQFLLGGPQAVFSTGVLGASGSVDHVVSQYLFPAGPSVCAEGSWLLKRGFQMSYTLQCERATLDFDSARGPAAMQVIEEGQEPRTPSYAASDGYGEEVRYAVDCIRQGRRPAIVTAQDGYTALQICEAEEKSIRTGSVVTL